MGSSGIPIFTESLAYQIWNTFIMLHENSPTEKKIRSQAFDIDD